MLNESDVTLVRWPAGEARRQELRMLGAPRLLLVEPGDDAPIVIDPLEDWVRTSTDARDVEARLVSLRQRAAATVQPRLDDEGRLHVGLRWITLSPLERRLIAPLVERFGGVAPRTALAAAGWPDGEPSRNQIDVHILRLRRRVEGVGLCLRTVRGRGYSLTFTLE